ncbi:hypothetical protein EV667_2159 [Ancylobacter aquaticus]|uniref:J domain-containing protein n=1 Tax=Ancylobacter aquaticus TaxID=100 RepID=A0A4R1IC98_ANCAQ|nr:hypothetical protein [Ancylobacter aquaticus]TCK28162.1 hypothetical protein EV667_2159 [Ancylobacter aquaticus]
MSLGVMVSSAALIISLLVTAIKFVDWLSHSDPRSIMRMGRLGLLALAVMSIPALMTLLATQQWTGAMLLGSAMLLGLALVNWRRLVPRRAFRPLWQDEPGYGPLQRSEPAHRPSGPDPELARRAAIVLQDYLALAGREDDVGRLSNDERPDVGGGPDGGAMGAGEAMALLGLQPGASAPQIRAAHRRLMQLVHPDRGGTDYLAMKINRAKDVLLASAASSTRPKAKRGSAVRKPSAASRASGHTATDASDHGA